jgi:Lysine methyltransferase
MLGKIQRGLFGRHVQNGVLPALPGKPLSFRRTDGSVIGGSIYPMAAGLCHHLLGNAESLDFESGPSTIELGAGTGAVGVFAAALGGRCVLTDKKIARAAAQPVSYSADGLMDVLPGSTNVLLELLQGNVDDNQRSAAHPMRVMPLDWMDPTAVSHVAEASPNGRGFELVLGSDISYEHASHGALAAAIERLLRRPTSEREGGLALIAHETRLTDSHGTDIQLESFVRAAAHCRLRVERATLPRVPEGSTGTLLTLSHAGPAWARPDAAGARAHGNQMRG